MGRKHISVEQAKQLIIEKLESQNVYPNDHRLKQGIINLTSNSAGVHHGTIKQAFKSLVRKNVLLKMKSSSRGEAYTLNPEHPRVSQRGDPSEKTKTTDDGSEIDIKPHG